MAHRCNFYLKLLRNSPGNPPRPWVFLYLLLPARGIVREGDSWAFSGVPETFVHWRKRSQKLGTAHVYCYFFLLFIYFLFFFTFFFFTFFTSFLLTSFGTTSIHEPESQSCPFITWREEDQMIAEISFNTLVGALALA